MSERVEREFKKWKEEYDIPLTDEFQVKTLLKLQEEYDNISPDSSNTKTRETLIQMIRALRAGLLLRPKTENIMYVDIEYISKENKLEKFKCKCYVNGREYIIANKELNLKNIASTISFIAKNSNAMIYIDANGIGLGLYDELIKCEKVCVKKLECYKKPFLLD